MINHNKGSRDNELAKGLLFDHSGARGDVFAAGVARSKNRTGQKGKGDENDVTHRPGFVRGDSVLCSSNFVPRSDRTDETRPKSLVQALADDACGLPVPRPSVILPYRHGPGTEQAAMIGGSERTGQIMRPRHCRSSPYCFFAAGWGRQRHSGLFGLLGRRIPPLRRSIILLGIM